MFVWILSDFENVGIPEGWKCPYFEDVEKYYTDYTINADNYFDDGDMFYAGVYFALNGEFDEIEIKYLKWWLDPTNWDVAEDTYVDYSLKDIDGFDYETSDMFFYAVYQAEQGEFDEIESCEAYTYLVDDYNSVWDDPFYKEETINHYNWHPMGECYKISQEFNSNLGQAIQYIYRSGGPVTKHDDVTEDLQKAINFLQYEIERIKNEKDSSN